MVVKDSVAIVTGGASGLGEACIRNLATGGAKVVIFDIQKEQAEKLVAELGEKAIFVNVDVTNEASVINGIKKTIDFFGAINIAINCAGSGVPIKVLTKTGPHPMDVFNRIVRLNLMGTFNVIRLAIEQMVKNNVNYESDKGVIINTASVAAFDGQIGMAAYSASKAAVCGMTLPIARECAAYGIRMMTIAPGTFETPHFNALPDNVRDSLRKMVPFPSRLGKPQEFASLCRHIIENQYLNGEVIRLDGAIRMAAK
jgi:3-hydroxyacyl-CoA dehydrogenase/3-hydroxy-2-methylbutyryl-CoA dehydrogenase